MKIFIGSSAFYVRFKADGTGVDQDKTKSESPLTKIIKQLMDDNHIVEPWWEDGVLSDGEHFLDSLIAKSRTCDGGIFIFRADDSISSTATVVLPSPLAVPRGNVLLECGMFYGAKGKFRTFIIKDGNIDKLKIPTDIQGHKIPDIADANLLNSVSTFFDNTKLREQHDKITFYFNKDSVQDIIDKKYDSWSTKSLYVGSESARRWRCIENDPNYLFTNQFDLVSNFIREISNKTSPIINFKKIDNIISMGPGCGVSDNEVVSEVYSIKETISYVPIDINPHLAFEASNYINDANPELRVPFAIVDDFEKNYQYVGDIIKRKFHDLNQTNLFIMLGGTFANLEGNEKGIVQKIKYWMGKADYLLLDAFIKSNDYKFDKDSPRHVENLPQPHKDLILNAVIKRYLASTSKCPPNDENNGLELIKELSKDLKSFVKGKEETDRKTKYTELSKTSVTTYKLTFDKTKEPTQDITVAKRYDFEELKEFLKNHFQLLHSFNGLTGGKTTSRGLFLLKKK